MKVLYAGDSAILAMLGLEGAEIYPVVDQVWDAGHASAEALEGHGIEVVRMLSHVAYSDFPETAEELGAYDAVILSDIGHDTLVTYPGERRYRVPMGPNRLKEIVRFVEAGGGLVVLRRLLHLPGALRQGPLVRHAGRPDPAAGDPAAARRPHRGAGGRAAVGHRARSPRHRGHRLEREPRLHGLQPRRRAAERRPPARPHR